jgi:hypothetical protein
VNRFNDNVIKKAYIKQKDNKLEQKDNKIKKNKLEKQ